ncbi:MAG: hypothetical protein AB9903_28800 [Vulcanimicrobiota bacterium]
MNKRVTKVVGFSVPPSLYSELVFIAKEEQKTKSELFRDMFDIYKRFRNTQRIQEQQWIRDLIAEGKREKKTFTKEQEEAEYQELLSYGTMQAEKIGLASEEDLERYLNEQ